MSASAILTAAHVDAAGYTVSYKAPADASYRDIGTVEANEDFRLSVIKRLEEFTASQFGEGTVIDGIYAGQSCLCTMVLQEINNPAALGLVHPESQQGGTPPTGGIPGELGVVGALASTLGGSIKLTPFFTSLPVLEPSEGLTEIELPFVWIEDGHEIRRQLSAGRHTIPLSLRVFAFIDEDDSNTPKLWRYI